MSKKVINLTKSKLREIIKECVDKIITESNEIKSINYNGVNLSIQSFDMNNPDDKSFIENNKDKIWDLLQQGYESLGGFKGFGSRRDMMKKSSMFHLGFQDGEIITVSVYNGYLDGNKCVGATCVKDEKHENAVKLLNLIIEYDIQNWEEWVWIEASGKIEEIFNKYGGFNVPTKYVKIFLRNIPFNLVDEYHYSRNIGGNMETKTIFGFKDESTFEFLKKEITDKVNAFINRTKINESLNNSEEEIEQIWNRFSKNENEIEKDRDIINYFVYLKDDELINEFPKECLDLLEKSIANIQRVLESSNYDIKKEKQYRLTVEEGLRVINTSTVLEPLKMIA